MAFEDLHRLSREYILALTTNIDAGTHTADIVRYSGSIEDPRSRIVQAGANGGPPHEIILEGYSAGDAFQRLIVKGLIKGSWVSSDTWEGVVDESALEAYRAG
jgi:hypothetical protein